MVSPLFHIGKFRSDEKVYIYKHFQGLVKVERVGVKSLPPHAHCGHRPSSWTSGLGQLCGVIICGLGQLCGVIIYILEIHSILIFSCFTITIHYDLDLLIMPILGLYPFFINSSNALSIPLTALHLKFARMRVLKRTQLGKI